MSTAALLKTDPRRRDAFDQLGDLINKAAQAVEQNRSRDTLEYFIEEIKRNYNEITDPEAVVNNIRQHM